MEENTSVFPIPEELRKPFLSVPKSQYWKRTIVTDKGKDLHSYRYPNVLLSSCNAKINNCVETFLLSLYREFIVVQ